ncbi:MAG: hypothetical protein H0X66_06965 [Verrucomicrobia bacterium]|nr:hypothetical protein [Verrucomicrobiota bacterium]
MSLSPLTIKNPNDPTGKWHSIYQWVFEMLMYVTANGQDEPTPPFGKTPTPSENEACDAWLRKVVFIREVDERHVPERSHLSWLFARLLVAREYVDDQIRGFAAPPPGQSGNDTMLHLLVDRWHEELHKLWSDFAYDGKNVRFRDRTVMVRPNKTHWLTGEDPGNTDDTAVTWKNLHNFAEMLAAAMCQRVEMKLPFGEMPTPKMDARCDNWFKKFFSSENARNSVESSPLDLAPWLAARLVVATGIAFGNMEMNPNPPTEKALWICLRNIVITRWNQSAKQLWKGMYMKEDGKIGFRGDPTVDHLQSKSIFFSMN